MIILFIDEKYEPDNCKRSCRPPCRLIRKNFGDCLKKRGNKADVLTALKFGQKERPGKAARACSAVGGRHPFAGTVGT